MLVIARWICWYASKLLVITARWICW